MEKKYTLEEVNALHKAIGPANRDSNPADNTWFALKDNWMFILFIFGGVAWVANNMFALQSNTTANSNRIGTALEAIERNQTSITELSREQKGSQETINKILSATQLIQRDINELKTK